MSVSLGTLAGLPPSPLFASEVLIIAGGFAAGRPWTAGIAAALLALGFLGLAQALIELVAGKARVRGGGGATVPGLRGAALLGGISVVLLAVLTAAAFWLPGSELARALAQGIG
jgi:hydrogenase-4 component F